MDQCRLKGSNPPLELEKQWHEEWVDSGQYGSAFIKDYTMSYHYAVRAIAWRDECGCDACVERKVMEALNV